MSFTEVQNSPRQSPSPTKNGLTLPPINASIKSYLNSPLESPRPSNSNRGGLSLNLMIGSTPDVKAMTQSVRGSRPHNISIDSISKTHKL